LRVTSIEQPGTWVTLRCSRSNDVVALVDAAEEDVAEVDRPHTVGDLLESDRMLLERMGGRSIRMAWIAFEPR
jgi:hypothetical protein